MWDNLTSRLLDRSGDGDVVFGTLTDQFASTRLAGVELSHAVFLLTGDTDRNLAAVAVQVVLGTQPAALELTLHT
jgi:hypothetical protein